MAEGGVETLEKGLRSLDISGSSTSTIATDIVGGMNDDKKGDEGKDSSIERSKSSIRLSVWKAMEEDRLIQRYPPTCHDRIPNFLGSRQAAERLAKTSEFRAATVVKVNPSLAQMPLRFAILDAGKQLIVPSPALTNAAFMYRVDPTTFSHAWQRKRGSSKKGAEELGSALSLDKLEEMGKSGFKIDLYVVASVAVGRNGVRLGKGRGFAELEWAILYQFGLVDANTVVATTVHERQILDERETLHSGLMESHDLPVDIIVTPRRIVNTRRQQFHVEKPEVGVLWEKVTEEMWNSIPILKDLHEMIRAEND